MNVALLIDRVRQMYGKVDFSENSKIEKQETEYKRERGRQMREWLARDVLANLIQEGNYVEVCQRVPQSFTMDGPLARWDEYQWVRNLEGNEQADFAKALYEYLYGSEPFLDRLEAFVRDATSAYRRLVNRDPDAKDRYRRRTLTWPFVSYFHFMLWSEERQYPFLKPMPLTNAAKAAGFDLQYRSAPNAETYARTQEFYAAIWPEVEAHGGQDWIDVQTVIHVAGGGFGVPNGGWVDQTGVSVPEEEWRRKLRDWLKENPRTAPEPLVQLRKAFQERFPKGDLAEMTLEEYALGHEDSKDSFCYWLEWETDELGSIRGGSSAKFGVWWSKAQRQWRWNKGLEAETAEEAWHKIRDGLVKMVQTVEAGDFGKLDEVGARALGPNRYSLRSKPLCLYCPNDFLPISNPDHLAYFLECFGQEPEGDLHALNLQLLATLRDQDEFEGFDTLQMMRFLYEAFDPGATGPEPDDDGDGVVERTPPSLEAIQRYISGSDLVFQPEIVANYHLSILTKPFVILTGLSGTGKTRLTRLYADAVYDVAPGEHNPYYQLVAVRPDWNDHRGLLGYYNPLTETYDATPFLRFLLKAACHPEHWYYVCLDEMNLARVEYYFSDFLSVLEAEEELQLHPFTGSCVATQNGDEIAQRISEARASAANYDVNGVLYVPARMPIPPNLVVTGTVNVDETTHNFSDKVLDRANSIEFNQADVEAYTAQYLERYPDRAELVSAVKPILSRIYDMLEPHYLHFGYRILAEILGYLWQNEMLSAEARLPRHIALDNQIMQKILPKLRGDERIQDALESLQGYLAQELGETSNSVRKLGWMLEELKTYGSTHFWR
ncbi:MAG: McrB family protein [Anaerolineae bacterium]